MPTAPFDFTPRTRLLFQPGGLNRLGECTAELGGRRVLLVTDNGLAQAGHPQRAASILTAAGLEVVCFDEVQCDPTVSDVNRGFKVAREANIDFLVGLGGGSSMDCAKGINFLLTNGGSMEDYWGFGKAARPMLPMIAVPTTAGTGSEAQSYAIIARDSDHLKMACGDPKAACKLAILDPELTLSMPHGVTAATGIDALSHSLESFVTNRRNAVSKIFSREAWVLLSRSLTRVLQAPHDLEARGEMLLGAHWAGIAIENSMLGAAHACANPLSAHFGLTHGVAVGLMLPHVIRYNAVVAESLYAQLISVAGIPLHSAQSPSEVLADYIRSLFLQAELQPDVSRMDRDLIPALAAEAMEQWTGKCNPRPLDQSQFEDLYRCALA